MMHLARIHEKGVGDRLLKTHKVHHNLGNVLILIMMSRQVNRIPSFESKIICFSNTNLWHTTALSVAWIVSDYYMLLTILTSVLNVLDSEVSQKKKQKKQKMQCLLRPRKINHILGLLFLRAITITITITTNTHQNNPRDSSKPHNR